MFAVGPAALENSPSPMLKPNENLRDVSLVMCQWVFQIKVNSSIKIVLVGIKTKSDKGINPETANRNQCGCGYWVKGSPKLMLMALVMMTLLLETGFWLDQKHWRFTWLSCVQLLHSKWKVNLTCSLELSHSLPTRPLILSPTLIQTQLLYREANWGGAKVSLSPRGTTGPMHLPKYVEELWRGKNSNFYGSVGYRKTSHHSTSSTAEEVPRFSSWDLNNIHREEGKLTWPYSWGPAG